MAPFVRQKIDQYEKDQLRKVFEVDNEALDLYLVVAEKESEKAEKKEYYYDPKEDTGDAFVTVKRYLTNYSVETAQNQFVAWRELEKTLLVKFVDGNVKAQNPDGTFKHSEFSSHLPEGITNPGYTDLWKQTVVEMHGETIEQPAGE